MGRRVNFSRIKKHFSCVHIFHQICKLCCLKFEVRNFVRALCVLFEVRPKSSYNFPFSCHALKFFCQKQAFEKRKCIHCRLIFTISVGLLLVRLVFVVNQIFLGNIYSFRLFENSCIQCVVKIQNSISYFIPKLTKIYLNEKKRQTKRQTKI